MTLQHWFWIGFNLFVLAMLALDLGVFHRRAHVVTLREAITWTAVWITLAMIFNLGLWYLAGPQKALEFFLGEQQSPKSVGNLGTDYGIALARMQMGEYGAARALFRNLRAAHPGTIAFHTGLANAELALGNKSQAFAIYDQAMALFPRNVPLTVHYAEALLANGDPKKAHGILLDLLNNVPPTAQQVRLIALAASAAGDTAEAHYYMAELHLIKGDATMAADQLHPSQPARTSSWRCSDT